MILLLDLRKQLIHKRLSLQGTVGNQATVEARDRIQVKIDEVTEKINNVNDCITLRKSETTVKESPHVSLD